jgi:hypothetical protein
MAKDVSKEVSNEKTVYVTMDTEPGQVLQFVKEDKDIVFEAGNLPKLDDELVRKLPYYVASAYIKEQEKEDRQHSGPTLGKELAQMLGSDVSSKIDSLRKRSGYHTTWRRPDEFDECMSAGYTQIREAKVKKDGTKEGPGSESGEVIMIGDRSKPELIAMEIPIRFIEQHELAVSLRSTQAYKGNKEGVVEKVDQINSSMHATGKEKIAVIDDEHDVG